MPIEIVRNDITKMKVDAIVNPAGESLSGGGGVDGAIHRAAGPELLAACRTLHGCAPGDAKVTKGYRLPCKYIIHTVGPVWRGGGYGEREQLVSCYQRCLALAVRHGCGSVAFPLISAGAFGYPREDALRVATDTIRDFLLDHDLYVFIVIFDRASFHLGAKLYARIKQYIDDYYAEEHLDREVERKRRVRARFRVPKTKKPCPPVCADVSMGEYLLRKEPRHEAPTKSKETLNEVLGRIDETFSRMVLRKIKEKGITEVTCYRRANIDRKLFSKIRSGINYSPSKRTALALAIALELPIEETRELLMKAGLALSHSNKADLIVEYFILNGIYKIDTINQALFDFGQTLLGV